jgi:DNA-binding CsgD family transcriptional regulator
MTSVVEELENVADLCARIRLPLDDERDVVTGMLEPVAAFLRAESASFRSLSLRRGIVAPDVVTGVGIPASADDAYLSHYFELDPARRLLQRRLKRPLFADPTRDGEWSAEHMAADQRRRYRAEFLKYRDEFLLPNGFFHHVGFCFQDEHGRTLLFDFHRPARAPSFGKLELARARVVATYLCAGRWRCAERGARADRADVRDVLSDREAEVAEVVALGLSNKEVAARLGISVRTVENHLRSIFAKLHVTKRARLAAVLHAERLRDAGPRL